MFPRVELRDQFREPRVTIYLAVALALGLLSAYASYHTSYPRYRAIGHLALTLSTLQIVTDELLQRTFTLCLSLGVVGALLQALDRGRPLVSWVLVASPILGHFSGGYIRNLIEGNVLWGWLVVSISWIGLSILFTIAVFTLLDAFTDDARTRRESIDVYSLLARYSFLFLGVATAFVGILGGLGLAVQLR